MRAGDKRKLRQLALEFDAQDTAQLEPIDLAAHVNDGTAGAIGRYLKGGSGDTNRALRSTVGEHAADVEKLDAAMSPLPADMVFHRQVFLDRFGDVDPQSLEGKLVRDAAYANVGRTDEGTGQVRMHIAAPAGTPAIVLDDYDVMLGRDLEMAVTSVVPDGRGGFDMHLAILDSTPAPITAAGGDHTPNPPAPEPDPPAPPQPTDPLRGVALGRLTDDQLSDLMGNHADDGPTVDRIIEEMERRDASDAATGYVDTEQDRKIDDLVSRGWEYRDAYAEVHDLSPDDLDRQERAALVDDQKAAGETRDDVARKLYDQMVHVSYLEAEDQTRGYLLTKAAAAAGVDPIELFSGPASRARKHASEELKRYWAEHPRVTFAEFKADLLGRASDVAAAAGAGSRGNGRDFGV